MRSGEPLVEVQEINFLFFISFDLKKKLNKVTNSGPPCGMGPAEQSRPEFTRKRRDEPKSSFMLILIFFFFGKRVTPSLELLMRML